MTARGIEIRLERSFMAIRRKSFRLVSDAGCISAMHAENIDALRTRLFPIALIFDAYRASGNDKRRARCFTLHYE